jgi:hypothetical protein
MVMIYTAQKNKRIYFLSVLLCFLCSCWDVSLGKDNQENLHEDNDPTIDQAYLKSKEEKYNKNKGNKKKLKSLVNKLVLSCLGPACDVKTGNLKKLRRCRHDCEFSFSLFYGIKSSPLYRSPKKEKNKAEALALASHLKDIMSYLNHSTKSHSPEQSKKSKKK